jgi:hypothetical protein
VIRRKNFLRRWSGWRRARVGSLLTILFWQRVRLACWRCHARYREAFVSEYCGEALQFRAKWRLHAKARVLPDPLKNAARFHS